jgi:hypothetical protein
MDGSLATNTGRKELSTTNEDPRQVTPITTRTEPRMKIEGAMKTNNMLVAEPMKPNVRSNVLRLRSVKMDP